jgi:predicted GNAT family acetyltransferase
MPPTLGSAPGAESTPPGILGRMRCETTSDPGAFLERVSDFLLRDPVVHNVLVTNIAARRDGAVTDPAPATYAAVLDGAGAVVGAAMRTPPFSVVLSSMPAAAAAPLAEAMAASCPDAPGTVGPAVEAQAFATAWAARTGRAASIERRERLYRLDAVTAPAAPPGDWRAAEPADSELVMAWLEAFDVEVDLVPRSNAADEVEWRIADRRLFVWVDGAPASFASATRPAGAVVRIGPVYTPPERRRRGYAGALVAAISQRALDGGAAHCCLYTDLGNPTSNRIYVAVGYRPVGDVTVYRFARPT